MHQSRHGIKEDTTNSAFWDLFLFDELTKTIDGWLISYRHLVNERKNY